MLMLRRALRGILVVSTIVVVVLACCRAVHALPNPIHPSSRADSTVKTNYYNLHRLLLDPWYLLKNGLRGGISDLFGFFGGRGSCVSDEDAAKAASQLALRAIVELKVAKLENRNSGFTHITAGTVPDDVFFGTFLDKKIVYFKGTDNLDKWVDNARCALVDCGFAAVARDVDEKLPAEYKGKDVVVAAFSRGNFFASAYLGLYPDNGGVFVSVASPGHQLDPTKSSWTVLLESLMDPISALHMPFEKFHYEKTLNFAQHKVSSYLKGVLVWTAGGSILNPLKKILSVEEIGNGLHCKLRQ